MAGVRPYCRTVGGGACSRQDAKSHVEPTSGVLQCEDGPKHAERRHWHVSGVFLSSHLDFKASDGEAAGESHVELQAEGVRVPDPQLLRFFNVVDASPDMHRAIRRRPGAGGRISPGDVILRALPASP